MFVLDKEMGDVITMSMAGLETKITIVEYRNGKFKLAIDAPAETKLLQKGPKTDVDDTLDRELRANYRQELLMF